MIEADLETVEMLRPGRRDPGYELLRRDALVLRRKHDRRAVRVVGADEMHFMPLHPLEAHPDVGLDVFHDVADVKRPVGVRERRRDKKLPARCLTVHLFATRGGHAENLADGREKNAILAKGQRANIENADFRYTRQAFRHESPRFPRSLRWPSPRPTSRLACAS
jgi:hypothetical protein